MSNKNISLFSSRVIPKNCFFAFLLIFTSSVEAYDWMANITQSEYMASSPMCKRAIAAWNHTSQGRLGWAPQISRGEAKSPENWETGGRLIWRAGGWHYCGGVIRIQRGEASLKKAIRQRYVERGIADCRYTWNKLDKRENWAAEIGTTIARGHKTLKNYKVAGEHLDEVLQYHSAFEPAYLLYGLIFYEQEQFEKSKEYFRKAIEVTKGQSAEGEYFMGLASVKTQDIEDARQHAEKAEQLGYPLPGLRRLIAKAEGETP